MNTADPGDSIDATRQSNQRKRTTARLLVPALLVAGTAAKVVWGEQLRPVVIDSACQITSCSPDGMVTAGWLLVSAALAFLAALGAFWTRASQLGRAGLFALAAPPAITAMLFAPGRGRSLSEMVSGPGSGQFASGLSWAAAGAGVTVVLMVAFAALSAKAAPDTRLMVIAVVVGAIAMAAALSVAIGRADPAHVAAGRSGDPFTISSWIPREAMLRAANDWAAGIDPYPPEEGSTPRRPAKHAG